jgi:HAD superfamily hydrolase (TIGR01509 family)
MEQMVQLHAELRRSGWRTFIFSNTNDLAIGHIRRRFPFFAEFDGYVLSYQAGAMKPDARIYESVERMTGCCGAKVLYLDDRPENIAAGAVRGWQVILQETPEKSRAEMQRLGLL